MTQVPPPPTPVSQANGIMQFIDMDLLRAAGYPTRKAARKDFFTKARV